MLALFWYRTLPVQKFMTLFLSNPHLTSSPLPLFPIGLTESLLANLDPRPADGDQLRPTLLEVASVKTSVKT